ncbi:MAG: N-acetylmuramoyl-L-alanine amidase [Rikenellaceae bacterium]|nr:N-acetylmuramoyl-L-alanine amidase [Rikenellaceae bacterium]
MNKPEFIIIHCSATKEGADFSASDIDRWHRARGFRCIGYHYVVRLDGSYQRGRQDREFGAHCPQKSMNRRSVSICYIGGLDDKGNPKDTRTVAQKATIISLIRTLRARYGNLPVIGHRDVEGVAKACPCFDAVSEYKKL